MRRSIFVSTTGAGRNSALDFGFQLLESGYEGIELSGGKFDPRWEKKLMELAISGKVVLHNYFPVPADSFVLNLASSNPDILSRTVDFITKSIDISSQLKSEWYGIHAGFLYDPAPSELGRELEQRNLFSHDRAYQTFIESVRKLSEYATGKGVRLLLENHVLNKKNYLKFNHENPLLMVDATEIKRVLSDLGGSTGFLLDVGHLKVSGNTLGFDPTDAMIELNDLVEGYQLSDNDGITDQHENFDEKAWFADLLNPKVKYITFEIGDPNKSKIMNYISSHLTELGMS